MSSPFCSDNGFLRQSAARSENFLKEISKLGDVRWMTATDKYNVWGLPFYNEGKEAEFNREFTDSIMKEEAPNGLSALNGSV